MWHCMWYLYKRSDVLPFKLSNHAGQLDHHGVHAVGVHVKAIGNTEY